MSRNFRPFFLVFLSLILAVSAVIPANAQQSSWAIRVSMVSALEKPDEMTLKVYFSVYDPKTDLPILNIVPKSSSIALPQTNFTAQTAVTKPDVPIYIAMVLDASGSMGGAAEDLKKAAKLALNNTPDNSLFSVIQFNEDIKLIQDYTQNIPAVSYAIDHYRPEPKGTCLYDAAYSTVESLAKAPPGRRAIILFTDGRDENANGKVCSKHTFQELSDLAQKDQIPVNTIGLAYKQSQLNEVELKGIAESTGGYSAIAKQDDMGLAFQNIMDGLKSQWMVDASVYPKKGSNQGVLTLNLKDQPTLGATFDIESLTDYPGPPSPVVARFDGLLFRPQNQTYDIQLSATSAAMVDHIKVEVWDVRGGSKVSEFQFTDIKENNVFNFPTDQLVRGKDYELRLTAISKSDQTDFAWATTSDGKKITQLIHPFTFDPGASLPSIQIQSVTQQNNDLLLAVTTTNPGLITGFDGWLVDEQSNTQVPGSTFTSAAITSVSGNVIIPLSKAKVPDGKYTAVVRVLGKDNQVYSTTQYQGIVYAARLPDLMQLVYAALVAAPIVVFLIVAILLGLAGFMMYTSSREKSLSGTPVLQGRMGARLSGGRHASGPVIPIATEEPIPQRSAPPVSSDGGGTLISPDSQALASGMARPSLVIVQSAGIPVPQGQIPVTAFPFSIGRTEGALVIAEPNISRRHAQITRDPVSGVFFITDLNSSNGTRLNNQPIVPGQPAQLLPGSQIGLGPNVILRFNLA